jgi:hypothetical protein
MSNVIRSPARRGRPQGARGGRGASRSRSRPSASEVEQEILNLREQNEERLAREAEQRLHASSDSENEIELRPVENRIPLVNADVNAPMANAEESRVNARSVRRDRNISGPSRASSRMSAEPRSLPASREASRVDVRRQGPQWPPSREMSDEMAEYVRQLFRNTLSEAGIPPGIAEAAMNRPANPIERSAFAAPSIAQSRSLLDPEQSSDLATLKVQERMHAEKLARIRAQINAAQPVRFANPIGLPSPISDVSIPNGLNDEHRFPSNANDYGHRPARENLNASVYFTEHDRTRAMQPVAVQAAQLHVMAHPPKAPTYTPGDHALTFVNEFEEWVHSAGRTLDHARQFDLPHCLKQLAKTWHTNDGIRYLSWVEWRKEFLEYWRDPAKELQLRHQAMNLAQAPREPVNEFVIKKLEQFRYYCPELSEQERINCILNTVHARNKPYLATRNYTSCAEFLQHVKLSRAIAESQDTCEQPYNYSSDPHVVAEVLTERQNRSIPVSAAFKRNTTDKSDKNDKGDKTDKFEKTKRFESKPKEAGRRSDLPHYDSADKSKLVPATDKTARPAYSAPFKPRDKPNNFPIGGKRCFNCNGVGHYANVCTKPKNVEIRRANHELVQSFMIEQLENGVDISACNGIIPELDEEANDFEQPEDSDGCYAGADIYSEN